MTILRGHRVPLSLSRRWVGDMLHFSRGVPLVAGERVLRLKPLALARRSIPHPPTWNSLIIKALGTAGLRHACLRRSYMPYPWAHLHEANHSVASVVFDRDVFGESATVMAPMIAPELMTTQDIHQKLQNWKTNPMDSHGALRRLVRNARYPWPVRRVLWNLGLYANGDLRARNFGTFGVNSVAGMRGTMLMFQTPITSVWYYGSVNSAGEMQMQCAFDHRVMDGVHMARAWLELEAILHDDFPKRIATV